MTRLEYLIKFRFRVFPCINNEKRPAVKGWNKVAFYNPTITGNYGVLASGHPYNGKTIVVVDLDNHSEKEESGVQFWEKNKYPSDTLTVETPSGGKHLYFLASQEQIKEIEAIGSFKLHKQIDFFWKDNHYVIGVGSVINGKEYKIINGNEPADLPECVIELLKDYNAKEEEYHIALGQEEKGEEKDNKKKKKKYFLHEYEKELIRRELDRQRFMFGENKEDEGFYYKWFNLGCSLKNLGFDVYDWMSISYDDEETQMLCAEKWETIERDENSSGKRRGMKSLVKECLPYWNDIDWRFDKLEDIAIEKALSMFKSLRKVIVGKDVYVINEKDEEETNMMNFNSCYEVYQQKKYRIDYPVKSTTKWVEDGKEKKIQTVSFKEVDAFPIFFKNAEVLKGIITKPEYPYGVVEINGNRYFNDFKKVNLIEGDGTYDLFFDHMKNNLCNGDEEAFNYLKMWVYSLLLYRRSHIALCIFGNQGCGKSIFTKILSLAFHKDYSMTINSAETFSNHFDSGWKKCWVIGIEEFSLGLEKKRGIHQKLKDLITNDECSIELKGVNLMKIENHMTFILTSNFSHITNRERGDRRFFCLHCNDNHRLDVPYFSEMFSEMRDGGMAKLVKEAEKQREEVQKFNFQNIPENEGSIQNMVESAPEMLQWLLSKIEDYIPENGVKNMPFFEQDGEILINSNSLIDLYCSDTGESKKYFTTSKISGWLKEWTGGKTENRRIMTSEGLRTLKCFCFDSIGSLKRNINANYFGDKNPLLMGD